MEKCPNCGYQRQPGDTECPQCGVVYEKYEAKKQAEGEARRQEAKRVIEEKNKPHKKKFHITVKLNVLLIVGTLSLATLLGGQAGLFLVFFFWALIFRLLFSLYDRYKKRSNLPKTERNPGMAAVLSFFIPCLGQIYNGYLLASIIIQVAAIIGYFFLIGGIFGSKPMASLIGLLMVIPVHLYAVFDAYKSAVRINDMLTVKCPYCGEMIKSEVILCRYCGKKVNSYTEAPERTTRFRE